MGSITPNKGYTQPTVGGDTGTWGTELNASLALVDSNMGGNISLAVGGTDITLTSAQAANLIYKLTGTLTASINLIFPAAGGFYLINNATTGAFTLTAITSAGGSVGVAIAQGSTLAVYSDGTNVINFSNGVGNWTVTGNLAVNGTSTLTGNVTCGGTLGVTGAATFSSTVNGCTLSGSGTYSGTGTFSGSGTFSASGIHSGAGNLAVSANTTLANASITLGNGAALSLTANKTLTASDSTTLATGAITLGNGKVLTLSDSYTLATSAITLGNAKVLTVSDSTTLATSAVTLGNGKVLTLTDSLTVSNAMTLQSASGAGKSLDIGDGAALSQSDGTVTVQTTATTVLTFAADGRYSVRCKHTSADEMATCDVDYSGSTLTILFQSQTGNLQTFTVSGSNLQLSRATSSHGVNVFHTRVNF